MKSYTPEELRAALEKQFPMSAQSWHHATDEVRDLARYARKTLGLGESHAVNFQLCDTPAKWNTRGINGIIKFYTRMTQEQRDKYIRDHGCLFQN
jgi:hypothetical protein